MKKTLICSALFLVISFLTLSSTIAIAGNCTFPESSKAKAPQWICSETNPGVDTNGYTYIATGTANLDPINTSLSRSRAIFNARTNLAFRLKNEVLAELKSYLSQTGYLTEATRVSVIKLTEIHFVNIQLTDTPLIDLVVSPGNKLYALVGAKSAEVFLAKKQIYDSVFKSYNAAHDRKLAAESFKKLEKKAQEDLEKMDRAIKDGFQKSNNGQSI